MVKKRNKDEKEKDLTEIKRLALENPLKASSFTAFVRLVMQELALTEEQARRDVLEWKKQAKSAIVFNYQDELAQKLEELNILKERSLATNNLNAYLGAIKCEAELMGLKSLKEDEAKKENKPLSLLEEKKKAFLAMLQNAKE